ncbi:hypothetical protein D623_10029209 [Myotis brandtii]|uniref:Uncharacterized protein n=1 Tax=Myotis brandtii TaxID=109478 RepID=S7MYX0_MYOBR|nr:hypothetical protein D623_10029209 [Myotis brandtii]
MKVVAAVAVAEEDSQVEVVAVEDSSELGTGSVLILHARTWTSLGGMNATMEQELPVAHPSARSSSREWPAPIRGAAAASGSPPSEEQQLHEQPFPF